MHTLVNKSFVYFLICTTILLTMPRRAAASSELPDGKHSADEAAAPEFDSAEHSTLSGWHLSSAWADTTGYEFPEEEEKKNLVLEIAVYVVVAAFVAYFIIEVFLQGDTDEPPPPSGGKPPPGVSPRR